MINIILFLYFLLQAKKVAIFIARAKTEKSIYVLTEELRVGVILLSIGIFQFISTFIFNYNQFHLFHV